MSAALAAALACAGTAAADPVLPDLVADPPENVSLVPDAGEGGVPRLLMRFDGHVHNAGSAEVRIRGQGAADNRMASVEQLITGAAGPLLRPDAEMKFENTDGHNHWHLQRVARYSLWDQEGEARVAPVMKVGFCLLDAEWRGGGAQPGRTFFHCLPTGQQPGTVVMGVSPGWRDLYESHLPFQWVDVSETQPGGYRLRSEIDPEDVVDEADEANVPGETRVAVPGYKAGPGSADASSEPRSFAVGHQYSGTPGTLRLKVVTPPEHGTLDVPTGEWVTGRTGFTYTPDADAPPNDRFVYVLDDADSDFPRYPARGAVVIGAAGVPRVSIGWAPTHLSGGTTTRLVAAFEGPGPVAWSASAGSIDAAGRYTAPTVKPAGGTARITATLPGGASDAMDIEILAPPPPDPDPAPTPDVDTGTTTSAGDTRRGGDAPRTSGPVSPSPAPPRGGPPEPPAPRAVAPARRVPVGSVRFRFVGPQLSVAVVPRVAGRLRVTLLRGRRRLASCSLRVVARRAHVCRLRRRSGATAIAVTLVRRDGRVEQRRVRLRA